MKRISIGSIALTNNTIGDSLLKRFLRHLSNIYLFVITVISCILVLNDSVIDTKTAMCMYGVAAVVLIVKISVSTKLVFFGPLHILLLYTIVSNFGYDILVMLYPNVMYSTITSLRHAYSDYFNLANAVYFLGTMAFILGIESRKRKNSHEKVQQVYNSFSAGERRWYMNLSLAFICIYVFYLLLRVVTGRLPLTNYLEVKDYFSTRAELMYMLRMVWVAMPTYMFFTNNKKEELLPFGVVVGIMFVILMFTGNRNEILYPLAMTLGVYVWKRYYLEKKGVPSYIIWISIFIVFIVNPMISNSRKGGFDSLLTGAFGLVEGLMEMGQQLNPFSIILYALDKGVYSFQYGMTMIVPSVSVLSLNMLFGTKLYLNSGYNPTYILNQLNHFGRGFSYIAEWYVNFGVPGVVAFFAFLGRFARNCESGFSKKNTMLMYFQISTLLMLWARNTLALNITIVIFAFILQFAVRLICGREVRI